MNTMETIRTRRSIRKYKPGADVTQEQIDLLLEAAMLAPSACNTRPWEFIVIRDRSTLTAITEIHPYTKMLNTASLGIVICALPETQTGIAEGYFPQDCGAATQNILLEAVELGLGACWCGIYPKDERIKDIKKLLSIETLPFCVIAVGVPDENPAPRGSYEKKKVRYIG
jgi:nitroreductase